MDKVSEGMESAERKSKNSQGESDIHMTDYLCPKCGGLLQFKGLTPNKVYAEYQCYSCSREFILCYDNKELRDREWWYIMPKLGKRETIRDEDENPKPVNLRVIFS